MNKEDLEKYIKTLELQPDHKYIVFISVEAGLHAAEIAELKLRREDILFVLTREDPHKCILMMETKK